MSKRQQSDTDVIREVWDALAGQSPDGVIDIESVIEAAAERYVVDVKAAKIARARQAFAQVDRERTKDLHGQLVFFNDPSRFLVIGEGRRAQEIKATYAHVMAARGLKVANLRMSQASLDAYDDHYFPILEYLAQGMIVGDARDAYRRDHPEKLAAD